MKAEIFNRLAVVSASLKLAVRVQVLLKDDRMLVGSALGVGILGSLPFVALVARLAPEAALVRLVRFQHERGVDDPLVFRGMHHPMRGG